MLYVAILREQATGAMFLLENGADYKKRYRERGKEGREDGGEGRGGRNEGGREGGE